MISRGARASALTRRYQRGTENGTFGLSRLFRDCGTGTCRWAYRQRRFGDLHVSRCRSDASSQVTHRGRPSRRGSRRTRSWYRSRVMSRPGVPKKRWASSHPVR